MTTKIAIISDIHGNLPALEIVLEDIKSRKINQIYCLGDLIDFAPWGNEVIDHIKNKNIPCLLGNHDERVAYNLPILPLEKHSLEETINRTNAINHSKKNISESNKKFLSQLPYHLAIDIKTGKKFRKIQLVHATLFNNEKYIYPENEDYLQNQLSEAKADILVMGHTHCSFVKKFGDKLAINCGSVGRSREKDRLATFLTLTISESEVIPEIVKLNYPIEKVANEIEKSEIPNFYANFLLSKQVMV